MNSISSDKAQARRDGPRTLRISTSPLLSPNAGMSGASTPDARDAFLRSPPCFSAQSSVLMAVSLGLECAKSPEEFDLSQVPELALGGVTPSASFSHVVHHQARHAHTALPPLSPSAATECLNVVDEDDWFHPDDFWAESTHMTVERALRENWTEEDMEAAYLQSSLLAYSSHHALNEDTYVECYSKFRGFTYVRSKPQDYVHNCPWNNWTPPSESERLFQVAAATPLNESISRRIRVRLIPFGETKHKGVVAFITAEDDADGKACIVIRRGAVELGTFIARHLRSARDSSNPKLITLTVATKKQHAPATPESGMHLCFENEGRLRAFEAMLVPGAKHESATTLMAEAAHTASSAVDMLQGCKEWKSNPLFRNKCPNIFVHSTGAAVV
jgi:hypothetical protein